MAIISESTKLQDLVRALSIQYDMFLTNKQYKNLQFKDKEEEYLKQQNNLANQIKHEEELVQKILDNFFQEYLSPFKLIAYDSRYVSFNKAKSNIGMILVDGITNAEEEIIIKKFFKENFLMDIHITRLENLPEDLQKKFKK